jgi:transketolase
VEAKEIKAAVDAAVKDAVKPLVAQIKGLETKLGKQEKELQKATELAGKAASSLSVAEPVKKLQIPTTEFEVNGKVFKFKVPQTVIKGTNYLAEEILASDELKEFVATKGLGRIVTEVF